MRVKILIVLFLFLITIILIFHATSRRPEEKVGEEPEETVEEVRLNPVSIVSFSQSAEEVPLYSKFEITLQIDANFTNPFDPKEIDIFAIFQSESGLTYSVPAFYYQEYNRTRRGNRELLRVVGEPVWKIRFTPFETGRYTFKVNSRNPGNISSVSGEFNVVPSSNGGFVRVCEEDERFFRLDNGQPIFFTGINLGWHTGANGTYDYERWFRKMSENGINLARIWMASWSFAIEWERLGYYNLKNAWMLDWVLNEAEKNDIYIMLCLINHGQFSARVNPEWSYNPYNSKRGGPLDHPSQFFTNKEAEELFLNRLRYIVARWGYSTHLMVWELWNEVDLTDSYNPTLVREWHDKMGRWLKQNDPYKHLVSTSFSNPTADLRMWDLQVIDFSQIHTYTSSDFTTLFPRYVKEWYNRHSKPVIIGEFSLDAGGPPYEVDPGGLNIRDGIWSTALAGSAATGMSWWWDNYIEPRNLFTVFKPLSEFTEICGFPLTGSRDWSVEADSEVELKIIALGNQTMVVGWIKDSNNTWLNVKNGYQAPTVKNLRLTVRELASAEYQVSWFDTYSGSVVFTQNAYSSNGSLTVNGPEFTGDIAFIVRKKSSVS
ncbi:MAG: DUF5060 domain-containing protein [Thermoproteota archaeon]